MNNIQEKDWADDDWSGHTGMESDSYYCTTPISDDDKKTEKGVFCKKSDQQPFAIHYEFIRRGEAEIVFSLKEKKMPVRALFFTDPLLDLTETALQLHKGASKYSVVFIDKSGEHHLVFESKQERNLNFEIRRYEKGTNCGKSSTDCHKVVLKGSTTIDEYCLQILKVLGQIEQKPGIDQYKTKWINAEFPREAYFRLKVEQDSLRLP